jgi:hypothetical protein
MFPKLPIESHEFSCWQSHSTGQCRSSFTLGTVPARAYVFPKRRTDRARAEGGRALPFRVGPDGRLEPHPASPAHFLQRHAPTMRRTQPTRRKSQVRRLREWAALAAQLSMNGRGTTCRNRQVVARSYGGLVMCPTCRFRQVVALTCGGLGTRLTCRNPQVARLAAACQPG